MFFLVKLPLNQITEKIVKNIRRYISKTSYLNSNAILKHHNTLKFNINFDQNNFSNWSIASSSTYTSFRTLSTNQTEIKPSMAASPFVSKKEREEFLEIFPDIVRDLTDKNSDIAEVNKRLIEVMHYNVPKGAMVKGLFIAMAYKMLEKPDKLTPENIRLANILGWCIELTLAYLQMADDIMDNSEITYNNPCWYRKPEVGLRAINDAELMCCGAYQLLKQYFSTFPCYVPILELFNKVIFKTLLGQSLDSLCMENNKPRLDMFTMNKYLVTVKYKTAYCTSLFPVVAAMYFANIFDREVHQQCEPILIEMAKFNQIRNDFEDCFSNVEVTGKVGTDIQNGKCTWLAVIALERAAPAQRAIMEEHYGKPNPESVHAIRNLYEELNLESIYTKYQEESFNLIYTQIEQLSKELPIDLLLRHLKQIYRREY